MTTPQSTADAAAMDAATHQPSDQDVPPDLQCLYPGKNCRNARTTKRDGSLHRLCAMHRDRANKNQWWVDERRRLRRVREHQRQIAMEMRHASEMPYQPLTKDTPMDEWEEEDVIILQQLLLRQRSHELDEDADDADVAV